jgi:hypothetical protein
VPSPTSSNSSTAGGARHPACCGTADDSHIAPSTRAIDAGSWLAAKHATHSEHRGHTKT